MEGNGIAQVQLTNNSWEKEILCTFSKLCSNFSPRCVVQNINYPIICEIQ